MEELNYQSLMIGDLVYDGNSIAQVTGITCDGIIETTHNQSSNIEIIRAIPLSVEILEKIGFEYINDEYGCWLLGKIELREREPYNGLFEVEINIAKETIYIHYVHELQHVLKLCGSQKDVVL